MSTMAAPGACVADKKPFTCADKLSSSSSISSSSAFGRRHNVVMRKSRSAKINAMAKELYFNKDGSAVKKLQVSHRPQNCKLFCFWKLLDSSFVLANIFLQNCIAVIQSGVNKLADLVGVTLGPKGRNVVLESKYGSPKIVNDGVTVAKEV